MKFKVAYNPLAEVYITHYRNNIFSEWKFLAQTKAACDIQPLIDDLILKTSMAHNVTKCLN